MALCIPTISAVGGAERQLLQLAANLDQSRWRVIVFTFDPIGSSALKDIKHIPILTKGLGRVIELRRALVVEGVDILQAYLVGAQVCGIFAKGLLPGIKLVAAVRSTVGFRDVEGWKGKISHAAVFALNDVFDSYVFNSMAADRTVGQHIPKNKRAVIFNGIETSRFRPDSTARDRLRNDLALSPESRIIGVIANVNVYKGYETMIRAAASVALQDGAVHFVALGEYRNLLGTEIGRLVDDLGLSGRWHFVGPRADVEHVVPAFDFLCSASWTEGFPNSIGEAMASGVPCVTTDVGDCAYIVGDTGWVVPSRDADALADAMIEALTMDRQAARARGEAARQRIIENFSLSRMVTSYDHLYASLLNRTNSRYEGQKTASTYWL